MAIRPRFSQSDTKARFDNFLAVFDKRIVKRLKFLGEKCVKHARENGDYIDRTGNLRSSVGYVVFKNGTAIHENFEQAVKTDSGTGKKSKIGKEGKNVGRELAEKVGSKITNGYALVVVAGMDYALHVESKGRDVLTTAEILANQEFPKMMEQLKKNIKSALSE